MSVDSENKSNEAVAPYASSNELENGADGCVPEDVPVTPEMVLRLPTITDSMTYLFPFYQCD